LLDVPGLLTEHPDHPDPRQRLLEVAGDRGDLLPGQPVGVGRGDPEDDPADQQDGQREEGEQGQMEIKHEQDHHHADQGEAGLEQGGHPVLDQLVERLDVVGEPGDDHPRAVA
jgi:hypothetical protein